jgi:pyridoxamine 5'-phosphate oxidase
MTLDEHDVLADPIDQFGRWYGEAVAAGVRDPDAMVVATVDANGAPSARVVLLRGVDARGFVFHTNLRSAKARDIAANARVACVLHWREQGRQVRIGGSADALPVDESDAYWDSRPRESQLGALASPQSDVLAGGRGELDALYAAAVTAAGDEPIPRPPWWGGWLVRPATIELWEHRDSRLHDRLRWTTADGGWRLERLAP